jgi:serine/threonine protein kinase
MEAAALETVLSRLDPSHAFTPRIYDAHGCVNDGQPCIVMEHAGSSLWAMLVTGDWSRARWKARCEAQVLKSLRTAAHGLAVFATNGCLHNDVKLENIMWGCADGGRTVLVDFMLLSHGPRQDIATFGKSSFWLPPDGLAFRAGCLAARRPGHLHRLRDAAIQEAVHWWTYGAKHHRDHGLPWPAMDLAVATKDLSTAIDAVCLWASHGAWGDQPADADEDDDHTYLTRVHAGVTPGSPLWGPMMTSDVYGLGLVATCTLQATGACPGLLRWLPQTLSWNMFARPTAADAAAAFARYSAAQ